MFRPSTPTTRPRHNIDTPCVSFFDTVRSYVILHCIIHRNPPCSDGLFSDDKLQTSTRAVTRRLRRNRIEVMFGRLKDWRRVATRYDRCPKVFLSAIALAALVIYWL
ncbi:transposase [Primorskyibacter sp. 2E233]|uniref:transposase n=1 Tax=Primorskyibacter sp. 2E233 TaxID=3413431 RepID=UPI003BF23B90